MAKKWCLHCLHAGFGEKQSDRPRDRLSIKVDIIRPRSPDGQSDHTAFLQHGQTLSTFPTIKTVRKETSGRRALLVIVVLFLYSKTFRAALLTGAVIPSRCWMTRDGHGPRTRCQVI